MQNKRFGIAIVGGNGSGKTTLGCALANALGFFSMDNEDYFFRPSAVPYTDARTDEEVAALMQSDALAHPRFVLSSVHADYLGIDFDLVISLKAPLDVRMVRVRQRAVDRFGDRVLPGGDMYEQEERFFDFVANRTLDRLETWLAAQSCPVLELDATQPMEESMRQVLAFIRAD